MNQYRTIHSLKEIPLFSESIKKLTIDPLSLNENEKIYILTVAIVCLKKYQEDRRLLSFIELAYSIILKYSITFNDYEPLFDLATNLGLYPIVQAIFTNKKISPKNINDALIPIRVNEEFSNGKIIETLEQNLSRKNFMNNKHIDYCYIAPTSFGKSSLIIEHIQKNWNRKQKIAIIVPTKSLLMQTYKNVKKGKFQTKIIIHDEMYSDEESFIAVLTQERALRLLDKNSWGFDSLYIDEAHRILEKDSRSILLTRLIRLNRKRFPKSHIMYFSPMLADSNNLKLFDDQNIYEQRIHFNMKEPDIYEYNKNSYCYKYNRFIDEEFFIGKEDNIFKYIKTNSQSKNFCYLYSPKKIEHFANNFSDYLPYIDNHEIDVTINNLKSYVHEDFLAIEYLKKGIIYLHGKMPDSIKEYLEYKFSTLPSIKYLIANKVILEGMNLPIDTLFILNGRNMNEKDLNNLIGRVNRLDYIFSNPPHLERLIPSIHFVNNDIYNQKNGNLNKKMRMLKKKDYSDKIQNPMLKQFKTNNSTSEKDEKIIKTESTFFNTSHSESEVLKQRLIALGINSIYEINDTLCEILIKEMKHIKNNTNYHWLERLQKIFILSVDNYIIDSEFKRLRNNKAINYYKIYYQNRKKSLKDRILNELSYFQRRIENGDSIMYIGNGYGEISFPSEDRNVHHNVYIDLKNKNIQERVNIAIVKQKIEDDFTSFKLQMFVQLMYEYKIISKEEYNDIIYGTNNIKKIEMMKMGLTISMIHRLEQDNQLKNIYFDSNLNLCTNKQFNIYKQNTDDYFQFILNRTLG